MKNKKGFTLVELLSVVVILGLLMAVAVPAVSKMVISSRKKTLIETVQSYMSSLTIEVNDSNYYFSDKNTVFAVPIECIDVDKGGTDPFGVWLPATTNQWAYVLVQYDSVNRAYIYGFTFKDNQGYGIYPMSQEYIDADGHQVSQKTDVFQPVSGDGPECQLEVFGTLGENGWYKGASPVVQFKDSTSITSDADISDYGIGLSSSNYDFNKNTSYVLGTGITTIYGYLKDIDGNVGTCSVEVKYDDKVLANEVEYGYQVYPKSDIATVSGQYINLNSYIVDYGKVLGANIYLKSNSSGMTVIIYNGSSSLVTRTISAGVTFMNFSFLGEYSSLKIDMGSSSNISLIERIELITDHTTGFYTNQDVYAYASSLESVTYSFDGGSWQTDNKKIYTKNTTSSTVKVKDSVGNESEAMTISIGNIDKDSPVCGSNDGSTTWAKSRTVQTYCEDSFSGCRQNTYSLSYPTASVKNKKVDAITIYDKAGNSNNCSLNIYVDSTNPACTITMTNSNGVVSSGATSGLDVTFKGTGTDTETDASGISNVSWKVTGNGTTYSNLNSTSSLEMGTYSVYATCTDNAGNVGTSTTKTVTLKKVAVVTFNSNGGTGTMADLECTKSESCTLTANAFSKTGNAFSGWATSANGTKAYNDSGTITVDSDIVLYAIWNPETYPISYELDGGTNDSSNPSSYTYGVGVSSFADPEKSGYVFDGWYTDTTFATEITKISATETGSKTLYAKWYEEAADADVYKLTYVDSIGTGCDGTSKEGTYGSTWGTLCYPSESGYIFNGWYTELTGGTRVYASTEVDGDLTVYASWSRITYTLTYDNQGGSGCTSQTAYSGSTWGTLCTPIRSGHTFGGWYADTDEGEVQVTASSIASSNMTVYAKWSPRTYTISYELDGGTNDSSNPTEYTYGVGVSSFADAEKSGYLFGGWYTDTTFATEITKISTTATGSKTLYAKWTAISYTLIYDNQGGSGCTSQIGTYDETWGTLCTPTKTGYKFNGWYTKTGGTGTQVTASTKVTGNLTVYANWKFMGSAPTFTCDNSAYSWSNVSSSVDIEATDSDNDLKAIFYRKYNNGDSFSSTTSNPFTFTGKYYRLEVYVEDNVGNQSSISTTCYTKYDNQPYYAMNMSDPTGSNVESATYSCTGGGTSSRTCEISAKRIDVPGRMGLTYKLLYSQPETDGSFGTSPYAKMVTNYFSYGQNDSDGLCPGKCTYTQFSDGTTSGDCSDYSGCLGREYYIVDEAGNVSPSMYVHTSYE